MMMVVTTVSEYHFPIRLLIKDVGIIVRKTPHFRGPCTDRTVIDFGAVRNDITPNIEISFANV